VTISLSERLFSFGALKEPAQSAKKELQQQAENPLYAQPLLLVLNSALALFTIRSQNADRVPHAPFRQLTFVIQNINKGGDW